MSNLQLPENWPELSDYELGGLILALFIALQAERVGIPADSIPEEFAARVIEHVLTLEASSARLDSVEKAFRLAAKGELERAGERIRDHIFRGAIELKFVPIGIKKSRQARDFGRSGAEANKAVGQASRQLVYNAAKTIIAKCTTQPSVRQMARDIAKDLQMKEETVRGHLKALRKGKKLG